MTPCYLALTPFFLVHELYLMSSINLHNTVYNSACKLAHKNKGQMNLKFLTNVYILRIFLV